jgi:hypothetical protein
MNSWGQAGYDRGDMYQGGYGYGKGGDWDSWGHGKGYGKGYGRGEGRGVGKGDAYAKGGKPERTRGTRGGRGRNLDLSSLTNVLAPALPEPPHAFTNSCPGGMRPSGSDVWSGADYVDHVEYDAPSGASPATHQDAMEDNGLHGWAQEFASTSWDFDYRDTNWGKRAAERRNTLDEVHKAALRREKLYSAKGTDQPNSDTAKQPEMVCPPLPAEPSADVVPLDSTASTHEKKAFNRDPPEMDLDTGAASCS